jgi:uncharacterized protein
MRTGIAHLPLHGGKAPAWLFKRMTKLAAEISYILIKEHGTQEFLRRLSDPYWFQAFGCVLGFDWHSSGVTTTVCGALKEGLKESSKELGIFVCGGKGGTSRKTPHEIAFVGEHDSLQVDPQSLIYASKMSAKVDSAALQDGYNLYHHNFIFDREGRWAVIQQGMNTDNRWARRYHWLQEEVKDFVCEPHAAICCDHTKPILNMIAVESEGTRQVSAELATQSPVEVVKQWTQLQRMDMPSHHPVSLKDIKPENLHKILEKTYEHKPQNFEGLLAVPGVGPKTIRALSMISELIYGKPSSIKDPVRFSFAHGGKDGHPYPVNRKGYDESIAILKEAIDQANIGQTDKIKALKSLS